MTDERSTTRWVLFDFLAAVDIIVAGGLELAGSHSSAFFMLAACVAALRARESGP